LSDYYKIDGETTLHKYCDNPKVLETIIDHYVKQDPRGILAVLAKKTKRVITCEQTETAESQYRTKRMSIVVLSRGGSLRTALESDESEEDEQVKFKIELMKDVLDYVMDKNYESLINKILEGLARLPMHNSCNIVREKFASLIAYKNFPVYMDQWFEQTQQMKDIFVIYTKKKKGEHFHGHNCSYLDSTFFKLYPRSVEEALQTTGEVIPSDYKAQHVKISYARISSIFRTKESVTTAGPSFLKTLAYEGDLQLFNNKNLQNIIDFEWKILQPFFYKFLLFPFICLCYLPCMIIAFNNPHDENGHFKLDQSTYVLFALLAAYLILKAEE